VGRVTGAELREIGFNMNLAPVADLYARDDLYFDSRVLHRRTFGDDPERVGMQVAAYSAGLSDAGIISVTKHFPGHGGTADSHLTLPTIDMDEDTARATALRSFEVAVDEGVPAVMMGHLVYAELEPVPNLPASLSATMNSILRDDLGFDGLVMTDAMDMAAIAANFPIPEAALMAVEAGVDILVMGPNMSVPTQIASMQRIIDAVNNGELSEDDLNERVRRVLAIKAQYDILDWRPSDPETVTERINLQAGQDALLEIYMDAATVVRDDAHLLPLSNEEDVVIIYPARYVEISNTCLELAHDVTYYAYSFFPPDEEYNFVSRLGIDHQKVVIFVEDTFRNLRQRDLVNLLPRDRTVVVALGSPFDLELFPEHSTFMAMYNSLPASHAAACNVLFGTHPTQGRLPVAIADYATGSGIDIGTD
jgi:beta-N-acetylhexosaminidase